MERPVCLYVFGILHIHLSKLIWHWSSRTAYYILLSLCGLWSNLQCYDNFYCHTNLLVVLAIFTLFFCTTTYICHHKLSIIFWVYIHWCRTKYISCYPLTICAWCDTFIEVKEVYLFPLEDTGFTWCTIILVF